MSFTLQGTRVPTPATGYSCAAPRGTQAYCADYQAGRDGDTGEYPAHNPRCRKLRRRGSDHAPCGGIPICVTQPWVDALLDVR